jgi:hypothetical protein
VASPVSNYIGPVTDHEAVNAIERYHAKQHKSRQPRVFDDDVFHYSRFTGIPGAALWRPTGDLAGHHRISARDGAKRQILKTERGSCQTQALAPQYASVASLPVITYIAASVRLSQHQ